MLQLWLRCWLISGLMLCGWAGMFWVGISGIMFRSSLGGLLCRLQLLWGEFSFLLPASLYWFFCGFGFSVFLLFIGCCGLLVDSLVLELFLISAISILWWWFSVLKCSLLLFILLNDVRCCAFIGFNLRSSRFFHRLCLGFFKISLGLMAGVRMDGFFQY
jgi:hypothetical protein